LLGALAHAPEQALSPVVQTLSAGARVARYEVIELLGRGGMGAVYRARDPLLGREVALKLLFAGSEGSTVDRFRRELVALASVSHPNVVSVHDAGIDGASPYVVIDLVDGETLRARLSRGPMGIPALRTLACDLASGLRAAHDVGVVHRDLKPENVLIDQAGVAKLVDFGLAQLTQAQRDHNTGLTETGSFLGTAHYMAPEQMRGERVDPRADIFAFGAVLFEALTGRRAFDAPSRAEIITAVLRDSPTMDPLLLADEQARRLMSIALRCLEKSPDRRFQTGAELLEALQDDALGPLVTPMDSTVAGAGSSIPETRYAKSSGVHIAYQVASPPGPITLLSAPPFISNIEVIWESPAERAWIESLSAISHFIHYDRRGVGMSDTIAPECSVEERVEDLRSVLDAEAVERTFLLGVSEGGPISIAFAAKYPERTRGLVLIGSFARMIRSDAYPCGFTAEQYSKLADKWVATWGTPKSLSVPLFVASRAKDPEFVRWANRYERQCASPGTVRRLLNIQFEHDVCALLPAVRCPVLIIHRRGDPSIDVEHGRYLARHIPNARYVELDGIDHAPWHGDQQPLDLTKEFLLSVSRADSAR